MHQESQQSREVILKRLRTRRNLYTLVYIVLLVALFLIGSIAGEVNPIISTVLTVLMGVSAGLGMLCINQYRFEKSGGRKRGGGLWWLCLLIFGFIIVPLITVFVVSKITPLAELILGVKFER